MPKLLLNILNINMQSIISLPGAFLQNQKVRQSWQLSHMASTKGTHQMCDDEHAYPFKQNKIIFKQNDEDNWINDKFAIMISTLACPFN